MYSLTGSSVKKSSKFLIFSSASDIFYSIIIDSGATNSFIAKNLALKYSFTVSELPGNIPLFILDSNESTSFFITHYTTWIVDFPSFTSFEWDFFIIDSPKGEDLILGHDLLYQFNPIIDWKNGLITYDSSGIHSSTINDLVTSFNSVAVVGQLKTPSLPSSVHIPFIMPSQSLIQSRDEVFKEIKDFVGDVSISSLHLFQGDMDLPPLSFHSSLEEQWDEEEDPEEIETVLKVVPPSHHQYLDVLSMVKAEKLPPHRTCDHHIKLEGLLPPVGVIYSLSNQESETLWAYISGNVEKGFIITSSSSEGAPVLFVKKKDGGFCLCVEYPKLNAVTRKNRYPIALINQLLTIFNGSTIFSKIYLCGAYNPLRIIEGDEHLTAFRTKYGSYEYFVIQFGLTNAPASLKNPVNDILADSLDIFVLVYLDDIMVFSSS
ncbi:hypothetical protein O181_044190 [Austropuccinia psidii MF-1]|uniref:Reverse transcriptase domain-containing protein n=1 Tax=Austropuccinia psidii MF-1 TaxID=1389203 RepID=A0A9Q3HJX9_9BASI|nr:hypothetical protein [Austropuccinia psidii MF-1]